MKDEEVAAKIVVVPSRHTIQHSLEQPSRNRHLGQLKDQPPCVPHTIDKPDSLGLHSRRRIVSKVGIHWTTAGVRLPDGRRNVRKTNIAPPWPPHAERGRHDEVDRIGRIHACTILKEPYCVEDAAPPRLPAIPGHSIGTHSPHGPGTRTKTRASRPHGLCPTGGNGQDTTPRPFRSACLCPTGKPFSIVGILVACQTTVHRLPEKAHQSVTCRYIPVHHPTRDRPAAQRPR